MKVRNLGFEDEDEEQQLKLKKISAINFSVAKSVTKVGLTMWHSMLVPRSLVH